MDPNHNPSHVGRDNPSFEIETFPQKDIDVNGNNSDTSTPKQASSFQCDEHLIPLEELLHRYGSDVTLGLSGEQVLTNRQKYGTNVLIQRKSRSLLLKFLKEVVAGINGLMLICGLITLILYFVQLGTRKEEEEIDKDNVNILLNWFFFPKIVHIFMCTISCKYYVEIIFPSIFSSSFSPFPPWSSSSSPLASPSTKNSNPTKSSSPSSPWLPRSVLSPEPESKLKKT